MLSRDNDDLSTSVAGLPTIQDENVYPNESNQNPISNPLLFKSPYSKRGVTFSEFSSSNVGDQYGKNRRPEYLEDTQFEARVSMFTDFLMSPQIYTSSKRATSSQSSTLMTYSERIKQMLKHGGKRLLVFMDDLREFNEGEHEMARGVLQDPLGWIPAMEQALRNQCIILFEPFDDTSHGSFKATLSHEDVESIRLGFDGTFGAGSQVTPRSLTSFYLGQMLCIEGIVTSCSLVRPKLLRSMHYVDSTKMFMMKEYWDATLLTPMPRGASMTYPTETPDGKILSSEFGLSSYRDYQTVTVQEMPERAPPGQLPRSVDVVLDGDLVDRVKPGDRVQIIGVFKATGSINSTSTIPSYFRTLVVANNVRHLNAGVETVAQEEEGGSISSYFVGNRVPINGMDIENIRIISQREDLFDLLGRSIAPSIFGHQNIKRAILLMLLGGVEKNLTNGTHIRGDINIMLVGDPSTAKSQLLRYILSVAPLAIATTGRGSSGVGLTAAVTHDKETGERRLEAGAMVLADRGIVCIDEFDKMSDLDRVAIHEVMEQQTVTISKAGIHTSLNARCSVIAAANPIWGQYRESASPQENIRLPDSLLSRFDLLFVVLDRRDEELDRAIAEHVLKIHRWVPPGWPVGQPIPDQGYSFNRMDDLLYALQEEAEVDSTGSLNPLSNSIFADEKESTVTTQFLRKYIQYARTHVTPVLTRHAAETICAAYVSFRKSDLTNKEDEADRESEPIPSSNKLGSTTLAKTFPVTPRTLETLIRLATAHAKLRLSTRVERVDAKIAERLVKQCLYMEVTRKKSKKGAKQGKKARQIDNSSESSGGDDGKDSKDEASSFEDEKKGHQGKENVVSLPGAAQIDNNLGLMSLQDSDNEAMDASASSNRLVVGPLPTSQLLPSSQPFPLQVASSILEPSAPSQQESQIRASIIAILAKQPRDKVLSIHHVDFGQHSKETVMDTMLTLQAENKLMILDDDFFILI